MPPGGHRDMQAGCLQALWELGHWDIGILEYWSFRALKSRCSGEHWRVVLLDLGGLDSWRHKAWFISPSSHERGVTSDRQASSFLACRHGTPEHVLGAACTPVALVCWRRCPCARLTVRRTRYRNGGRGARGHEGWLDYYRDRG